MNAIILGASTKMADILQSFCNKVYLVIDKQAKILRTMPEFDDYLCVESNVGMSTIKGIIPRTLELIKWIKQYDLQIIFSQTKYDMLAAKLATLFFRKKVILLATSHNSYAWLDTKKVQKMSLLIRLSTDCYVALASFVYKHLLNYGIKEKNIVLLPNTIEYHCWKIKQSYEVKGTFKFVYVAYIYEGKGHHLIVEAINRLKDRYDISCDCYGDLSDENKDYIERINKKVVLYGLKDNFSMKGKIENSSLRQRLSEYDAYICPSKMEMSPVNILEAQASGLPVLASDVGGIPDLIHSGLDGLLFESGNVDDMVEKMEFLIINQSQREYLGNNARKQVSVIYNSQKAAWKLQEKIISNR